MRLKRVFKNIIWNLLKDAFKYEKKKKKWSRDIETYRLLSEASPSALDLM